MLKPLTLSLSLAVALGASSVSMAGGLFHGSSGCSTCGLASPQGVAPTAQIVPSAQCDTGCGTGGCGFGHKKLFSGFSNWCNKPKCYTYEWVLKKKRVWGHHGGGCNTGGCDTCGTGVYPTAQSVASPQGYSSPQAYGSGQIYGAGQATAAVETAAPAPAGDEAPPAPAAPAPATPEAPPAPAAPAPPAANAPQSSLLFSTPSGN
jgi:hypothetical protein